MFARLDAVSTLAFAVLAAAGGNRCNTGSMQCCNKLEDSHSPAGTAILGMLGVAVQSVTGQIGMECSPITAVGVSGTRTCEAHPVCCKDNSHGSAVSIGCVPITL